MTDRLTAWAAHHVGEKDHDPRVRARRYWLARAGDLAPRVALVASSIDLGLATRDQNNPKPWGWGDICAAHQNALSMAQVATDVATCLQGGCA